MCMVAVSRNCPVTVTTVSECVHVAGREPDFALDGVSPLMLTACSMAER